MCGSCNWATSEPKQLLYGPRCCSTFVHDRPAPQELCPAASKLASLGKLCMYRYALSPSSSKIGNQVRIPEFHQGPNMKFVTPYSPPHQGGGVSISGP